MTTLVATDLDRTLIYSPRAAGPVDAVGLTRVEEQPPASTTTAAATALAELDRRATWVPATTRTVEQYRRLRLPRGRDAGTGFAVCANGGVLLVDGLPDAAWAAQVRRLVAPSAGIGEVAARVERHVAGVAAGPVRWADGLFLWTAVAERPDGWVDELAASCADRGWRVATQGRKVHVLPVGLTKSAAVGEVRRRTGAGRLLAAGDSPLDVDLLQGADAGVRPAHGELHDAGWHADHVAVTTASGIRAGEEIARWLLHHVSSGGTGDDPHAASPPTHPDDGG